MKFDSNLAWKEASAAVSANRELLLALAGVFFVLPSFALSVIMPPFQPDPGADPRAMMAELSAFYSGLLPYALVLSAVQLVGVLSMLTLFTDRSRPTVGQAIKQGLIGMLPALGAQLLIGVAAGIAALLIMALGGLSGSMAIAGVLLVAAMAVFVWLWARFSLVAPVIAVERIYNPINVLTRSWRLTAGNAGRLLLFYMLLVVVFIVAAAVLMGVVGLVLALALSQEPARLIAALISSTLTAALMLYFIAALAAAHRQLAGPSAEKIAGTFE